MKRRLFLNKLFLGAVGIAIAPKILTKEPPLRTCGVIPYLAREGARIKFDKRTGLMAGDVITTGQETGVVREQNGNLIADLMPIIEDIQMNWIRMQIELNKLNL